MLQILTDHMKLINYGVFFKHKNTFRKHSVKMDTSLASQFWNLSSYFSVSANEWGKCASTGPAL